MTLSRRAFLRLTFVSALAMLFIRHLPPLSIRVAGSGVLVHTAGEFLA